MGWVDRMAQYTLPEREKVNAASLEAKAKQEAWAKPLTGCRAVDVRTKIDFIMRASPRRLMPIFTPFSLFLPTPVPLTPSSKLQARPHFPVIHQYRISMAAVFQVPRPLLGIPLPPRPGGSDNFSALRRHHTRRGVSFIRNLTFFQQIFSHPPRRRGFQGVTRIRHEHTAQLCGRFVSHLLLIDSSE